MVKENLRREAKGITPSQNDWNRKAPYDFTGCLAHMDLTYRLASNQVLRVTGILTHNEECCERVMRRLPPIPLHDHVWQVALQQLNDGAR